MDLVGPFVTVLRLNPIHRRHIDRRRSSLLLLLLHLLLVLLLLATGVRHEQAGWQVDDPVVGAPLLDPPIPPFAPRLLPSLPVQELLLA